MKGGTRTGARTPEELLEAAVDRLDTLLGLLVEWRVEDGKLVSRSAEEQTLRLARARLRPIEIASITGRAQTNIGRDLSKSKRARSVRRRRRSK